MIERYKKAEQYLAHNLAKRVKNADIRPNWISTHTFWYRRDTICGWEYVVYDVESGSRKPLFDHEQLAKNLAALIKEPLEAGRLPFESLECFPEWNRIRVRLPEGSFAVSLADCSCLRLEDPFEPYLPCLAPDGLRGVYTKDHDLWYRCPEERKDFPLTSGGTEHNAFGELPDSAEVRIVFARLGLEPTGGVTWSPDSRRLILTKYDESMCEDFIFTETVSDVQEPMCRAYPLKASAAVSIHQPALSWYIIDIEKASMIPVFLPENIMPEQGMQMSAYVLHWSTDGEKALLLGRKAASNYACVMELDLQTGVCRILLEEQNDTFLSLNTLMYNRFNVRVIRDGLELIWYSERSGWGHLYRYDLSSGRLLNAVTAGEWLVRDLLAVDEEHELLYFSAAGMDRSMDPYYRQFCRVGFDGSGLTVLTPENADHTFSNWQSNPFLGTGDERFPNLSPDRKYLVDTYSTVSEPPVTVVRSTKDGSVLHMLETADVSALKEIGWEPPERFTVKAADGITDLYGVIYKPSDFDPERKYPVIDSIYNGPQVIACPTAFTDGLIPGVASAIVAGHDPKAIAELGFIVVGVDPRGTPGRDKHFHDFIFRNYSNFGLDDHVAALHALGKERPYIDMDRIGIFGHSYGGYASSKAILKYPDVFRVCVSSAAVQEFRRSENIVRDYYANDCSEEEFDCMDNTLLAKNLKGRLLLVYGEHDENVRYDQCMRMIDALIKADREFDLLLIPNETHRFSANLYFRRRRMDYFVRHLLGEEPPKDYVFQP